MVATSASRRFCCSLTRPAASASIIVGVGDRGGAAAGAPQHAPLRACPEHCDEVICCFHHTSHVTRHTSHVTRHTSHVTRHTSHVIRHTSHVTRHTPHVTPHTSHLTPHYSHPTPHTSHLTTHTSHLTPHTSHPTPYFIHVPAGGAVVLRAVPRGVLRHVRAAWLPQRPQVR
jgi:hypothetical protein